jgi:hypothetical protein
LLIINFSFQAKYDQRCAQHKEPILPLIRNESTLNHDEHLSTHSNDLTSRHHPSLNESHRLSISTYENPTHKNV